MKTNRINWLPLFIAFLLGMGGGATAFVLSYIGALAALPGIIHLAAFGLGFSTGWMAYALCYVGGSRGNLN